MIRSRLGYIVHHADDNLGRKVQRYLAGLQKESQARLRPVILENPQIYLHSGSAYVPSRLLYIDLGGEMVICTSAVHARNNCLEYPFAAPHLVC